MKRTIVCALFVLIGAVALAQDLQDLNIITTENAPFNFTEFGQVRGIAADLLIEGAERVGLPIRRADIQVLRWTRAYATALREPNSVLFATARTSARESLFTWVGPIYGFEICIIAKRSSQIVAATIDDLAGYTIGTVRDAAPEQLLIERGVALSSLDRGTSPESNLLKLIADRIDAVAWNFPSVAYNLRRLGEDPTDYEVVYVLQPVELYYALHRDTGAERVRTLQAGLDELRRDGSYDRIVAEYFGPGSD